jgi:DNA invertase Pin-like site-specific DNA recombinase
VANIGYARCSTLAQDLTAQRQALAALGVPADRVYLDKDDMLRPVCGRLSWPGGPA